jgi:hypothetical protein
LAYKIPQPLKGKGEIVDKLVDMFISQRIKNVDVKLVINHKSEESNLNTSLSLFCGGRENKINEYGKF